MTYRTFATPEQLLKELINRYTAANASRQAKDHNLAKMRYPRQPSVSRASGSLMALFHIRIFDILRIWIENYSHITSAGLKDRLVDFVENTMKKDTSFDAHEACVTRLMQCIQRGVR